MRAGKARSRGGDTYYGARARGYESRRSNEPKWQREQDAVDRFLSALPRGSRCLDVPVGTGRFLPLYERYGHRAVGLDISSDMLEQAAERRDTLGASVELVEGDIFQLPFPVRSFDAAICVRLLNWFDLRRVERALANLGRVSRGYVLVSIRHATPGEELSPLELAFALAMNTRVRVRGALQRSRGGQAIRIHGWRATLRAIRRAGLEIVERTVVDDRGRGSQLSLVLLRDPPAVPDASADQEAVSSARAAR